MKKIYSQRLFYLLSFFLLAVSTMMSQGGTCADIEPFCAGDQALIFANCNNVDPSCTPTAEPGPDYDCLSSQPYPAWFYLQIDQAGRLDFQIIQNTSFDINGNPTGSGLDVDFIAWGPFAQGANLCDYTQLQRINEISCSYSAAPIENFTIPNAQIGEIYVLLITNYQQSAGFIKLKQTNASAPGAGSTDCSILTTQTGCEGDQFALDATTSGAINYLWEYDDGSGFVTIYNGNFPTINVTAAGDYQVTISFNAGPPQIKEFQIVTYPQPIIASPPQDLLICSNGTTPGIFDLTENDDDVRGTQDPLFNITYYHNQLEATTGSNPITPANAYPIVGTSETIWVRIEEPTGACYAIDSFEITFSTVTATPPASPHNICDQDADGQESIDLVATFNSIILNGQDPAQYTVTYHNNLADALTGNNPLPQFYVVTGSITIFARVENNTTTNCFATTQVDLVLTPSPIANPPVDLYQCDFGTTPGTFNLTDNDVNILGGQDPTQFTIKYYETYQDSFDDTNEIVGGVHIIVPPSPQTIYARIEKNNEPCFSLTDFKIYFSRAIAGIVPVNVSYCDSDGDGGELIDLAAEFNSYVLDGEPSSSYNITYHGSQADADNDVNPLANPYFVPVPGETVYIRLENRDDDTCADTSKNITINVDTLPIINTSPPDLVLCDDNNDGFASFDLTLQTPVITLGDPTLTVTYHRTLLDAQNDVLPLVNPYTNDQVYLDTPITDPLDPGYGTGGVWARVSSSTGICTSIVSFALEVRSSPMGITPSDPLRKCDDTVADGQTFFDLTVVASEVLGSLDPAGFDLYYYEDFNEATTAGDVSLTAPDFSHAIPDPTNFLNSTNPQDIYILLVGNGTGTIPPNPNISEGCYDIVTLTLIVEPIPLAFPPETMVACDSNNDGFASFDLTLQTPVITLGDPTLTVTYHRTLLDAQNDVLPLVNPYTNDQVYLDTPITDPLDPGYGTGGVWARVSSSTGICTSIVSFALEVRSSPMGITPSDPLRKCDDTVADGQTFFDLTVVASEVLGSLDPAGFDLYYYEDFNEATTAGDVSLTAPDFSHAIPDPTNFLNSTNPQDIYILLVGNGTGTIPPNPNISEGCYDIVTLTLIVDPRPQDRGPFEMMLCDDELQGSTSDDEISTFDLTSQNPLVTNNDPSIAVTWFFDYANEAADIPISNPTTFQNTATPQTVIGRVTSGSGCNTLVTLTLTVLPNPNPNTSPDPLELCDDDDDGIVGGWDLTLADADIKAGETDVSILYYEDINDAIAGLPGTEIMMPYTNIIPYNQTVYARVTNQVPPRLFPCYSIVELELIVSRLPDAPDATLQNPLLACDETGNGMAIFDLTVQDMAVYGVQNPVDFAPVTYYESQSAADAGTNAINPADAFQSSGQTIWVRLESLATGCARVTPFEIKVSQYPGLGIANNLERCDDELNGSTDDDGLSTFDLTLNTPLITNGDPTLTVYYYASASDQINDIRIANPTAYQNIISPQQEIFATVVSQLSCGANLSFFIIVEPIPLAFPPETMVACDSNNDGFASFDLSTQTAFITGGDPTLTVTYHGTLLDAQNDVLPLVNPYTNDQVYLDTPITDPLDPGYGTGGVWARVSSSTGICTSIVSFALEVRSSPMGITPSDPLRKCDDTVADGQTFFDLTVVASEVLGSLDPAGFDLYYYEDFNEATTAGDVSLTAPDFSHAIPDPTNFLNSTNPQDIYILLVGNGTGTIPPNPNISEGCYDIVTLTLIVDPRPQDRGPFEMMLCDDELQGSTSDDEISTFDLTSQNPLVTNNDPSIAVTWFFDYANEAADIPISNPTTFQNTATPQTVIGRVTSGSGCNTLVTLTLTVLPNPNPNTSPDPLELCDDDDDGIVGGWDLTLADADIKAGETDVSILYYEDINDAIAGLPGTEIMMPYTNIIPYNQTVYARVTNQVPPRLFPCYSIVELELIVSRLPDAPDATLQNPLLACDETGNGMAIFDLTVQDMAVYGVQNPVDFAPVTYYESQSAADAGTNAINPADAFQSSGQTIWVRLESLATGCARVTPFEIKVSQYPGLGIANNLERCDDELNGSTDDDGLSTFDLTLNTPLITNGDPTLTVYYYASASDQINDIRIANPTAYQNIISPQQEIFATVVSQLSCGANLSFFIIVEPIPLAFPPETMVACDSNNDGFASFDLSTQTAFITGGDPTLTVTYHGTLLDAQNDVLPLVNPYTNDQVYLDTPITDPLDPGYGTGGVWARVSSSTGICTSIVSFALEVRSSPMGITPSDPLRKCDDTVADGQTFFDLTVVASEVLGSLDPAGFDLYYYEDFNEATTAGDVSLTAPDFSHAIPDPTNFLNSTNPQDIYILLVGNGTGTIPPNPNISEGCYDIVTLTLIVDPRPQDRGPFEMMLCDDELQGSTSDDEISTFDLTSQNPLVTNNDPSIAVTWFFDYANEAADIPISNPTTFQNTATPQTVIGRVTSGSGCNTLVTLTLTVLPNPNPNTSPDPLELCDDDDDGIVGGWDLTLADADIKAGETDVSILYYEDINDAIAGLPGTEIMMPYTNIIPYNQTVYARVTNQVPPRLFPCYSIVELELIVSRLPDAPDATLQNPLLACDETGNGMAIFDLTVQDMAVYGVQNPVDFAPVTYYESQSAADAGTNAINPADAFQSSGQTIWVRLESLATGCARVTPFEIKVSQYPGLGIANNLERCDDELNGSTDDDGLSTFDLTLNTPLITNGDPTLTVYYYASASDQINDIRIANPTAYQNIISPQQEIFATVVSQLSCGANLSFFIIVNPIPVSVQPTPLVVCDVDSDGFAFFDLDSKTAEIRNGDPTLNVTYHENLLDANMGNFPLASPYANIVADFQTLYVRVFYNDPPAGTGCYAIVTLDLIVNPAPVVPQDLPDLVTCDDSGFAMFDLTQQEGLIYGSQLPSNYILTYHLSEADAIAGINFIAQPESYTNVTNPQIIWVRLEDNTTGCFKVGQFNLVVNNGLPIINPTPLEQCDDLGQENDGITSFNLTQKNSEITSGVLTQGVSYFLTEQDARDNTNRIDPDTAYMNITNPQVLYVRVEDSNSSCISFTTLTIKVINNPTPVDPAPIELCDDNVIVPPGPYDGVELFDLTVRNAQILNGNNWTLGYYESYDDAVNQNDEIVAPETTAYQNTSNPQTIYVRTTSATSSCFEIVELELIVNPLPDDSAEVSPYVVCSTGDNEIGVFDLETKVSEILGGQSQSLFEVSFYIDMADANAGINAIVNTTTYQNRDSGNNPINPQTIYTGIRNTETGCYIGGTQNFDLIVQRGATAATPTAPFIICDNLPPSDGFAEFDLEDVANQQVSDLRAEILAGQNPAVYTLSFYETLEGAQTGTDPITFPYVNTINPQRIYVRVINTDNVYEPQCYAVTDMLLKVEQLPEILLDEDYRLCVDENGNPIAEDEGGASPPTIDTGLDPSLYTFLWDLDGVILVGETRPSIIALQGGVYTVTYTELASSCVNTASATVRVSSPPYTYSATLINDAFGSEHVIEVTADGEGTYQYQLDNGPLQDSNIFEDVTPGDHTVTIKDIYGCGSVTFDVGVIDYPPYFTPNHDGYHDTWNIIGIATGDPQAKIYIFDRFGKLLKQLSPLGPGWDGTYLGNPLPSSDYWFRVEYIEDGKNKEFKGHFTLKR